MCMCCCCSDSSRTSVRTNWSVLIQVVNPSPFHLISWEAVVYVEQEVLVVGVVASKEIELESLDKESG